MQPALYQMQIYSFAVPVGRDASSAGCPAEIAEPEVTC